MLDKLKNLGATRAEQTSIYRDLIAIFFLLATLLALFLTLDVFGGRVESFVRADSVGRYVLVLLILLVLALGVFAWRQSQELNRTIHAREQTEEAERALGALVEALRYTSAALNTLFSLDPVLDRILDNVARVVPHDSANIMLIERGVARVVRSRGSDERGGQTTLWDLRLPVTDWTGARTMVETGQPYIIPDTQAAPSGFVVPATHSTRSYVGAPIYSQGQAIGLINLASRTPNFFTAAHAARLRIFAEQAATAIENVRLYEETQRRIRELTALNRIVTNVNSTLELGRVLDATMRELRDALGVERCALMLLDEQTNELVFQVSLGPGEAHARQIRLGLHEGIAGWVAREGHPVWSEDIRSDPRWYAQTDSIPGVTTRSIIALPLKKQDKVTGVIEVINKINGTFTQEDFRLLESISMTVTTAIENARLYGDLHQAYEDMATSRAAIIESRNTLRALFDGITDSIYILDRDFRIQAINRTAVARTGLQPQELIGKRCDDVTLLTAPLCELEPVIETFRTGQPVSTTKSRPSGNGETRDWEINTYPLSKPEGEIDRSIYIARDITEKRKMEATIVQSAKLSAVGALAAGIVHEIGNPMTAVIGNAQILLRSLEVSDPRLPSAQLIERAGLRVEKLVRNLLNLSRQEEYKFTPTDLNASIEDALSLVSYQLERDHVAVEKEFAVDLPLISASATHLQTVWTNLLLNARDAVSKKPERHIRIATRPSPNGQSAQAIFTDNGSGIAEADLAKIFEPFFTTKPQGRGTGLGLYVSQTVIANHHGTLDVQSEVSKGSTFIVTLPLASETEPDDEM